MEVVGSSGHQVDGWCSFKISFIKAILYVVLFLVAIGTPWYAKKGFQKIGMSNNSNNSEKRYEKTISFPKELGGVHIGSAIRACPISGFQTGFDLHFLACRWLEARFSPSGKVFEHWHKRIWACQRHITQKRMTCTQSYPIHSCMW